MLRGMPLRQAIVMLSAVSCFSLLGAEAMAQNSLIVSAGIFNESSDVEGRERISVSENERAFEYGSDGMLTGSLRFVMPRGERLRFGAGLAYYGMYRAVIDEGDDTPDPPNKYEFGRLMEFGGLAEYIVPITERIDLGIGAQAGLAVLFPDGDLQDEIDRLDDQNVGVWDLPRLGYYVAPTISPRWKLDDRLHLRADLSFKWERLHLFQIDETVDNVSYLREAKSNVMRTELLVGLEIKL